ncbi:hypothetical protein HYDPIDRAFT_43443 [Hydnomerulius pinastri MD-312]|uniref:Unplaced genomic scaffold scaffold_40, whole genome shotgun sequence n=1 Tax=Hydnomerulius pinastri MD-312 TaxID=994086 RepID=A0A0C9VR93_9AGAM|nr:hypothetical protein HYDPIDRAFT_43443 [Hydnomerulius pinastri MD-312]
MSQRFSGYQLAAFIAEALGVNSANPKTPQHLLSPTLTENSRSPPGQTEELKQDDRYFSTTVVGRIEWDGSVRGVWDALRYTPLDARNYPGRHRRLSWDRELRSAIDLALQSAPNSTIMVNYLQSVSPRARPTDLTRKIELQENAHAYAYTGLGVVHRSTLRQRGPTREVAVKGLVFKTFSKAARKELVEALKRAVCVWEKLSHENILPVIGVIYGLGTLPAVVCPWMTQGSMNDYLDCHFDGLTAEQRFSLINQVGNGLKYLHSMDLVHGNLTGTNILFDAEGKARLSDFGLPTVLSEHDPSYSISCHGQAVRWAAPELFARPDSSADSLLPTTTSDIYSFGCIALQVLSGELPYCRTKWTEQLVILKFRGQEPVDELTPAITPAILEFLRRCWFVNRDGRPKMKEVLVFLEGLQA